MAVRATWPRWTALGYVCLYGAAQAVFAASTRFHPAVNDVLGLLAMSTRIDWSSPESLHNGFFPFALPALLALTPSGSELTVAGLLTVAFSMVTLGATFVIAARFAGAAWALMAMVLVSVHPLFFAYSGSAGPDVIAVGLATLGTALYVREAGARPSDPRWSVLALAGLTFGLAGLFRYHAAILGIALLAWIMLRPGRRSALLVPATGGLVLGFLPQVIVNLAGGFGPLESDSAFTMYQSVVDINWQATGAIDPQAYSSALQVVTTFPLAFARSYLESAGAYAAVLAVLAVAVLTRRSAAQRTLLLSLLIGAVVYVGVVSTGNSPRGLLPLLPLAGVAIAAIAARVSDATSSRAPSWQAATAIIVLVTVVVAAPLLADDVNVVESRRASEAVRAATETAVTEPAIVDSAEQVLTNDFDLYFNGIPGTRPETIGGWLAISLNGRSPHDDVDLSSVTAFYCDASARGIRLVLWIPGTMPGLDPEVERALNGRSGTSLLTSEGTLGPYVATRIQPGAYTCP